MRWRRRFSSFDLLKFMNISYDFKAFKWFFISTIHCIFASKKVLLRDMTSKYCRLFCDWYCTEELLEWRLRHLSWEHHSIREMRPMIQTKEFWWKCFNRYGFDVTSKLIGSIGSTLMATKSSSNAQTSHEPISLWIIQYNSIDQ